MSNLNIVDDSEKWLINCRLVDFMKKLKELNLL